MLLHLHASLKPGGALLSSDPHGHYEEGWNGGRYDVYYDLKLGAAMYRLQGSLSFPTIIVLRGCGAKAALASERLASVRIWVAFPPLDGAGRWTDVACRYAHIPRARTSP